jgi:hypothetical protein
MRVCLVEGALRAWLAKCAARLANFLLPGCVSCELECIDCGATVAPSNADAHRAYFHPPQA